MRGVTKAEFAGLNFRDNLNAYYLVLYAFVLLALFISWARGIRIGRAWNAMREDEQVAEAMGVVRSGSSSSRSRWAAPIGSLGGALFAVSLGSLTPTSFELDRVDHRARGRDPRGLGERLPGVVVLARSC